MAMQLFSVLRKYIFWILLFNNVIAIINGFSLNGFNDEEIQFAKANTRINLHFFKLFHQFWDRLVVRQETTMTTTDPYGNLMTSSAAVMKEMQNHQTLFQNIATRSNQMEEIFPVLYLKHLVLTYSETFANGAIFFKKHGRTTDALACELVSRYFFEFATMETPSIISRLDYLISSKWQPIEPRFKRAINSHLKYEDFVFNHRNQLEDVLQLLSEADYRDSLDMYEALIDNARTLTEPDLLNVISFANELKFSPDTNYRSQTIPHWESFEVSIQIWSQANEILGKIVSDATQSRSAIIEAVCNLEMQKLIWKEFFSVDEIHDLTRSVQSTSLIWDSNGDPMLTESTTDDMMSYFFREIGPLDLLAMENGNSYSNIDPAIFMTQEPSQPIPALVAGNSPNMDAMFITDEPKQKEDKNKIISDGKNLIFTSDSSAEDEEMLTEIMKNMLGHASDFSGSKSVPNNADIEIQLPIEIFQEGHGKSLPTESKTPETNTPKIEIIPMSLVNSRFPQQMSDMKNIINQPSSGHKKSSDPKLIQPPVSQQKSSSLEKLKEPSPDLKYNTSVQSHKEKENLRPNPLLNKEQLSSRNQGDTSNKSEMGPPQEINFIDLLNSIINGIPIEAMDGFTEAKSSMAPHMKSIKSDNFHKSKFSEEKKKNLPQIEQRQLRMQKPSSVNHEVRRNNNNFKPNSYINSDDTKHSQEKHLDNSNNPHFKYNSSKNEMNKKDLGQILDEFFRGELMSDNKWEEDNKNQKSQTLNNLSLQEKYENSKIPLSKYYSHSVPKDNRVSSSTAKNPIKLGQEKEAKSGNKDEIQPSNKNIIHSNTPQQVFNLDDLLNIFNQMNSDSDTNKYHYPQENQKGDQQIHQRKMPQPESNLRVKRSHTPQVIRKTDEKNIKSPVESHSDSISLQDKNERNPSMRNHYPSTYQQWPSTGKENGRVDPETNLEKKEKINRNTNSGKTYYKDDSEPYGWKKSIIPSQNMDSNDPFRRIIEDSMKKKDLSKKYQPEKHRNIKTHQNSQNTNLNDLFKRMFDDSTQNEESNEKFDEDEDLNDLFKRILGDSFQREGSRENNQLKQYRKNEKPQNSQNIDSDPKSIGNNNLKDGAGNRHSNIMDNQKIDPRDFPLNYNSPEFGNDFFNQLFNQGMPRMQGY